VLGNKGGVGIGFEVDDFGSLAFITGHLAARASRLANRQVGRDIPSEPG
jgi:hypothetical protein